ncbi:hypothetical protein EYF80_040752 [Liparis tanakae]|uniref:Uncharacterized protein n=1 Tax=Liparis tanakae TaxID=230148 RepID=A0A4Z2G898_9TELE|nr:hypothetical protein EYF80_040752 [Liparis tanakae]
MLISAVLRRETSGEKKLAAQNKKETPALTHIQPRSDAPVKPTSSPCGLISPPVLASVQLGKPNVSPHQAIQLD